MISISLCCLRHNTSISTFQPLFFILYLHIPNNKVQMSRLNEGQSPQFVPVQYVQFTFTVVYFTCIHFCPDLTGCPVVRKSSGAFWKVSCMFVCTTATRLVTTLPSVFFFLPMSDSVCLFSHRTPQASPSQSLPNLQTSHWCLTCGTAGR